MQRRVFIRGQALLPINNDTSMTIASMSRDVIPKALENANVTKEDVTLVVTGNMLSGVLQKQSQVASCVAQSGDLHLKDTFTVDTACGSGGSAFRAALMAILSGLHDTALVVGIEQMKHPSREELTRALAQASDWEQEGSQGATFVGLNDTLHDLYCQTYNVSDDDDGFFRFSENAHANAVTCEHALLRKPVSLAQYMESKRIGQHRVRLYDACPTANGCAALVLSTKGTLGTDPVVLGSDCRTDYIHLQNRGSGLLDMHAYQDSMKNLFKQASITPEDVSLFEAHDAYSIMACLSLENVFCNPGEGLRFAKQGHMKLQGQLPMSTFGGLKARGHPVGVSSRARARSIAGEN